MTKAALVPFLRIYPHAVQASVAPDGASQGAVVGVAVTDSLEPVCDTLGRTRNAANLRYSPRIAFVLGGHDATVQYEGVADEPCGGALFRLERVYFERFPAHRIRESPADLTHFRTRPTCIRYTSFRGGRPEIVEWRGRNLARSTPLKWAVRAGAADSVGTWR